MLDTMHTRWASLMTEGATSGPYESCFPDGSHLRSVYSALANVLPGQHLIVFAPADWPVGELCSGEEEVTPTPRRRLSRREREVLNLIAAGADRQEIADELTISVATVRTHVRNLLHKLNARNRAHAIALAIQQGLIEVPVAAGGRGS
ncbi:MAG: response regulator transcription factor [Solirubrobacterales bacterium]|nr:response regulator transcription factor [Solirubrobacterales bacterium]